MNNKLIALLSGIVSLVVAGGVIYFAPARVQQRILERTQVEKLGAIPGNEIQDNVIKIGGVGSHYAVQAMSASSTACILRSPTASSTLKSVNVFITGLGGVTAGSFSVWKSNGSQATTVDGWLFSQAITNRLQGFGFVATGTGQTTFDNMFFATTSYVMVTPDRNFGGTGRCEVIWQSSLLN